MPTSEQMLLYSHRFIYRQGIDTNNCNSRKISATIREVEEENVFTSVGIRKE